MFGFGRGKLFTLIQALPATKLTILVNGGIP